MKSLGYRSMLVAAAALLGLGAAGFATGCSGDGGNATGAGGKSGAGGAKADAGPPVVDYTFDTDVQGFVLNDYPDTSSLNLAGKYAVDGGTGDAALPDLGTLPDGGAAIANPTLAFDATVDSAGLATSGSLKVTVTFTAPKQYVDVALNFSPPRDLSNRILRARLRQTSGNFSGGAQLHISTGPTYGGYGKADFSGIAPGAWAVASLDSSVAVSATAEALDLAMTQQVGIQIYSGTATTDAGTYANAGEQVVFNIDTIVSN